MWAEPSWNRYVALSKGFEQLDEEQQPPVLGAVGEALSAAILWHATFFFPTIIFGFISFLFLHISYRKLSEESHILEKELQKS